jgi:hypothetical protein
MRKSVPAAAALLAAAVVALSVSTEAVAQSNANQNASNLVRDLMTPWNPTTEPPAAPGARKKKKKKVAAEPPPKDRNEASWRLFRDSLPVYWPTAVKAIVYPVGGTAR